jgi:transcriptional regulator with XRE-family HTH domain
MNAKPVVDFSGLAALIKGHREMKRLSLRSAADECGVSSATLSRIERGEARPDLDTIRSLVDWVGVPLARVLKGSKPAVARARQQPGTAIENAEVQFRADPKLTPEAAEQLIKLMRQAYSMMVKRPT